MALAFSRIPTRSLALLLALTPSACGDSGGGFVSGSLTGVTGVTTVPSPDSTGDTTSGGPDSTGPGNSGTDGASGDTGQAATTEDVLKPDLGAGQTSGDDTGPPVKGCRKVDFLFVIDNAATMSEEQKNLINSFPSFLEGLQEQLVEAQDYHVMIVDTDAYVFAGCETICPLFYDLCPMGGEDYECDVTKPEKCEDVLGAGVVHPKGQESSSTDCSFTSQARYIDISEPDLATAFACAAKVGTASTDEPGRPMQALVAAVAPDGKSADCNLGFLRHDAILVVTFITNDDDGSIGTVNSWHKDLIAAKNGDEFAVVVLGLIGDLDKPKPLCTPETAESSPRMRMFVDSFGERGMIGSVCAPSYKPFFEQAVGIIDETCDGFFPPPL